MNKKGQSIGLVVGLIGGIAFLIIGIIIAFTVVGTLMGSNIIPQESATVTNESDVSGAGILAFANMSGYTLSTENTQTGAGSFVITRVWADYNQSNGSALSIGGTPTGYNVTVDAANYTIDGTTGNFTNATSYVFPNVSISYTYERDTSQIRAAKNLTANFSEGVDKVGDKIPTVLLIAAIVLILAIMAVLIAMWQRIKGGQGL